MQNLVNYDVEPLLEVEDLTVSFRSPGGLIRVINRMTFSLHQGEILTFVGESGSGKSMTSMAIMGLIDNPNAVITGSIRYRGTELIGQSRAQMRRIRGSKIAMVFQDALSAMTPVHTIGWQISEQILTHLPVTARQAKTRAIDLLGEMGMPAPDVQYDRYPHQLSGGMRQRAMIAMALSCNPSLLIADEPTTALDVTVQAQILELFRRLRRDHGSSIIFVTHNMGVVSELGDRVMVMYAGKIAEYGTVTDVLSRPKHPYTAGLLASIPPMSGEKPRRLPAIPGLPPSVTTRQPGCPFAPRCALRHNDCTVDPPLFSTQGRQVSCHLVQERTLL